MYTVVILYLTAISLLAAVLTIKGKSALKRNTRRIRERSLIMVSVLGGSLAMLLAMFAVRHKTQRVKFMAGLPLIMIFQLTVTVLAFNHSLSVSHYSIKTEKLNGRVEFALVTDLHSCDYGNG